MIDPTPNPPQVPALWQSQKEDSSMMYEDYEQGVVGLGDEPAYSFALYTDHPDPVSMSSEDKLRIWWFAADEADLVLTALEEFKGFIDLDFKIWLRSDENEDGALTEELRRAQGEES